MGRGGRRLNGYISQGAYVSTLDAGKIQTACGTRSINEKKRVREAMLSGSIDMNRILFGCEANNKIVEEEEAVRVWRFGWLKIWGYKIKKRKALDVCSISDMCVNGGTYLNCMRKIVLGMNDTEAAAGAESSIEPRACPMPDQVLYMLNSRDNNDKASGRGEHGKFQ